MAKSHARCGRASGPTYRSRKCPSTTSPTVCTRARGSPTRWARLYDRYVGPRWLEDPVNHEVWDRVDRIPDSELWRARERLRARLVTFARKRLRDQLIQRGANLHAVNEAEQVLDPDALTIGFARRFATYKRATLFMRDVERLGHILGQKDRPVQLIFAGKGPPQGRPRQGSHPPGDPPGGAAGVPAPHRLPGELRHRGGPSPGPGRGRLAQQSTPPHGGQRNQWHEGSGQRRVESERAGRLVVRGLRQRERLGHRTRRALRRPRRPGRGRGPGPLRSSGTRGGAALLRPGFRRSSSWLAA